MITGVASYLRLFNFLQISGTCYSRSSDLPFTGLDLKHPSLKRNGIHLLAFRLRGLDRAIITSCPIQLPWTSSDPSNHLSCAIVVKYLQDCGALQLVSNN